MLIQKNQKFEKDFYLDKKSLTRKIVLSNDVDVEYEEQVLQSQKIAQDDEEKLQEEMSFIFQDEHVPLENTDQSLNASLTEPLNSSMTHSGRVYNFKEMINVLTQTDGTCTSEKPLRAGKQNFDESIKTVLALSCVNAGITTEQACKAFQTTSEVFLT